MNVSLIQMDPAAARAKLAAYQAQLRRRADEEYEAAVAGYQALAEGTALINLADAFAMTGLGEDNRPRLAVARADRRQVFFRLNQDHLEFNALKNPDLEYAGSLVVHVPYQHTVKGMWGIRGYALVPMVPADVRPAGLLSNYFTLWEVEKWADRPIRATPDRDPYLLRHLIGDLYAVVAEWDLTELERAIMTGRRDG